MMLSSKMFMGSITSGHLENFLDSNAPTMNPLMYIWEKGASMASLMTITVASDVAFAPDDILKMIR